MKVTVWHSDYVSNDDLIIYTNFVARFNRWYLTASTVRSDVQFDHPIEDYEHGVELVKILYPEADLFIEFEA